MTAIHVPTVDKRKRIPQKAIDQVVEPIVEKFKPEKMILFGPYARGNPRPAVRFHYPGHFAEKDEGQAAYAAARAVREFSRQKLGMK